MHVHGSGPNGEVVVQLSGSSLQEQLTQDDANDGILIFSEPIEHIEIYNTDETNNGVFVVNGISITVPPKNAFKSAIGGTPSNQVTVTGATAYIVSRYA